MDAFTEKELNLLLTAINHYRDSVSSLSTEKQKALPADVREKAADLEILRDKILEKLLTF